MKSSNSGLKIIVAILVIVLIFGVIALVILVSNYSKGDAGGTQPQDASTADGLVPPEMFPANSPTKDSSKIIISEIRNNPDGSIMNVSLMIPPSLAGLSGEVNSIPVVINPIDTRTIRIDVPSGMNGDRLEILFKAGAETRSSCILNKADVQRTEGDCIW